MSSTRDLGIRSVPIVQQAINGRNRLSRLAKQFLKSGLRAMGNNIYETPIKEIMVRHVVTLDASDTIHDALGAMGENRVSAIPVVDSENRCVGILSTSDLVDMTRDVDDDVYQLDLIDSASQRFLLDKLAHTMGTESVQSYMSDAVTAISESTTLGEATKKMVREGIHHLPVVNDREELVGIVSTMDILAAFADAA
jgi:CBS domain-containing protein